MDKAFHENFEQCREQYLQNYVPYIPKNLKFPKRKKVRLIVIFADLDVPNSRKEGKAKTKFNFDVELDLDNKSKDLTQAENKDENRSIERTKDATIMEETVQKGT